MNDLISIFWFRQDLRLSDNPGLSEAAKYGKVLPVYILDHNNHSDYNMGSASCWWLHNSLHQLNSALNDKLVVLRGDPENILLEIAKLHSIQRVHWNRCYEPWRISRDKKIKKSLEEHNILVKTYNGSLLWEPWEVLKQDKTPYKVFTPFYRCCLKNIPPRDPLPKPHNLSLASYDNSPTKIEDLKLLPEIHWYNKLERHWGVGEESALQKFNIFFNEGLKNYKEGRNFPSQNHVSRLSPHLHFGEISPNYLWYKIKSQEFLRYDSNIDSFCSELGWREFSYYLLYHFPTLPYKNLNNKFDNFPWNKNTELLKFWQRGETGIPIVDAGMRELWQTGYMHNRVRMIVGSFLVKNLLLHWRHGERWFWDCLVDADLANNSASWQWVAGCGADAAPYFRIFNPVLQGEKFDSDGYYTRKFIPELKLLPNKYLFRPWEAPEKILNDAGVILGINYPKPIVDLAQSRVNALKAYKEL